MDSVRLAVKFAAAEWYVVNTSHDVTLDGTTYTSVGRKGIVGTGFGENLAAEVPAPDLRITNLGGGNTTRVTSDGLRGDTVTVTLLVASSGSWVASGWATTFTADTGGLEPHDIVVRLASADAVRGTTVPRITTQESGCQHNYKRGLCPYRGPLRTCDKGFNTPNGCRAHFRDFILNGANIPQSRPYGAFLGNIEHSLVSRG